MTQTNEIDCTFFFLYFLVCFLGYMQVQGKETVANQDVSGAIHPNSSRTVVVFA